MSARSAGCAAAYTRPNACLALQILLQVKGGLQKGAIAEAATKGNLVQAFLAIGKEEGLMGYWKGNLPQVCAPLLLGRRSVDVCTYAWLGVAQFSGQPSASGPSPDQS
jgi:hypothetical protein